MERQPRRNHAARDADHMDGASPRVVTRAGNRLGR
jgi:hypothetical protein